MSSLMLLEFSYSPLFYFFAMHFLSLHDHSVLTRNISHISCANAVAPTPDFITIDCFQ